LAKRNGPIAGFCGQPRASLSQANAICKKITGDTRVADKQNARERKRCRVARLKIGRGGGVEGGGRGRGENRVWAERKGSRGGGKKRENGMGRGCVVSQSKGIKKTIRERTN